MPLTKILPTILLVDDEPTSRLLAMRSLEQCGYSVLECHDGCQAQEMVRLHPQIRVIITDWEMPRFNGPSLVRWLREEMTDAYRFLIVLTGRRGREDAKLALQCGADEFLQKPLDSAELVLRVQTAQRLLNLGKRSA